MFSVRPLPEFTRWLDGLKDSRVRGAVAERIKRLAFGAGWRLYYTHAGQARSGAQIVVLLAGGSKRTQKKDVQRAKALAALLKSERDLR